LKGPEVLGHEVRWAASVIVDEQDGVIPRHLPSIVSSQREASERDLVVRDDPGMLCDEFAQILPHLIRLIDDEDLQGSVALGQKTFEASP